jgi:type IV secretory pathway VirD2 relaxase
MNASGAKAAALHLRYIERDGVERDGSKGVLYTADGPAWAEEFEAPRKGEKHQFRLIISPEDGADLDLTVYVRRLMATVERDVDRKLEWAAVNHHDTEHPHTHVVVRGIDRDGREVRLARAYISHGLRVRAQELATQELGPRQEIEIRRAREREVTQGRFTSLDREIERRARDNRVEVRFADRPGLVAPSALIARLVRLEGLRLAERLSATSWRLAEGWQQPLRELGARDDILKQIHTAISGDPARYRIVREGHPVPTDPSGGSPVVTGRVAAKGLSDELKGKFYAVIETPTGRAYHVPLDRRAAEAVRTGDIVTFMTKPEAHVPDASAPQADAPIRHRLVVRKEPLSLKEQVSHPGPVWLDRVKTDELSRYGFGAELRQAVGQRREVLRRLGVRPEDPNLMAGLHEAERRAVGREIARRTRQVFVSDVPDGFRGRVEPGGTSFPGSGYAVVSDGSRFVVIRGSAAARVSRGQTVALTRDPGGRILVRQGLERDGPSR